jgi:hypothetical protein
MIPAAAMASKVTDLEPSGLKATEQEVSPTEVARMRMVFIANGSK